MKMARLAGVVILYNPKTSEVLENIKSYLTELDFLVCIDNSNKIHSEFNELDKVIYKPYNMNKGLSYALNDGCKMAIENGADYIITLDQDTIFEGKSIGLLLEFLENIPDPCIVAPNIKRIYRDNNGNRHINSVAFYPQKNEEIVWAITSGSMFSKGTFNMVNRFDEKLFIAQIDQDFCCAVNNKGGKVIRVGRAFIYQELGNTIPKKFLKKTVYPPNHQSFRYYYIFRNEIYLRKKWGKQYKPYRAPLYKYLATIILYENKKITKIMKILKGLIDGNKMSLSEK